MRPLYLDYNATTPIAPSVQESMLPFLCEHYGHPASHHPLGRACHEAMEDARSQVATLLGCRAEEIVFTSGGTESNNLALQGLMHHEPAAAGGHLVISAIEHAAVREPARWLAHWGYEVSVVRCDRRGLIAPEAVAAALRPETRLVSVMLANHEIGVVQPISEIASVCRERGIRFHTDAVQGVGKIRTQVDELQVDLLSLSAHKFYGPKGIGALYIREGTALEPMLLGSGEEGGLRSGTPNIAAIVGMGKAAMLVAKCLNASGERLAQLRNLLEDSLRKEIGDGIVVHGAGAPRLPNTLCVGFPGVPAAEMLRRIPEVCASIGAAGPSGAIPGGTLAAMGLGPDEARSSIRLSLGWQTSEEDIERAVNLIVAAWESVCVA